MKHNNLDNQRQLNNFLQSKYFFLGFITGFIPFLVIMILEITIHKGIENTPALYKEFIPFIAIIISILNATILSHQVKNQHTKR